MKNQKRFKPYHPNQLLLLPPDMKDWLPDDDLVYFIMEMLDRLDLSAIYDSYDGTKGGQPGFDPKMMTGLLLYAYCVGLPSSRKIEKATYHQVPLRVLTADQHPDHDTIAEFRNGPTFLWIAFCGNGAYQGDRQSTQVSENVLFS